jgi:hypothetical protein
MSARRMLVSALALVSLGVLGGVMSLAGSAQAAACPNEASRQGPSVNLPECRVYEQVTPVNKGDAVDLFQVEESFQGAGQEATYDVAPQDFDRGFAAEDGEAFLLASDASFGPSAPSQRAAYVFARGAGGWGMSVVAPPLDQVQEVEPRLFDPVGLSAVAFLDDSGPAADNYAGKESAYQDTRYVGRVGGPYTTLFSTSGNAGRNEFGGEGGLVGGSSDLSKLIVSSKHALAAGAEGVDEGSPSLYETDGGGECTPSTSNCKLIVDPAGSLFQCGASLGQGDEYAALGGEHSAVSSDGSKVFFTAPSPENQNNSDTPGGPGCWGGGYDETENPPELYVWDGTRSVEVSAPEAGVALSAENPLRPAVFVGASTDGSKVFFMTRTELTKDDTGHAVELYEYETETGKLTRVSRGESGSAEGSVDFVAAVSKDGSSVYFTAFGALASGATALPQGGQFDPVNLYRYDTLTGETTYITQVGSVYGLTLLPGSIGSWTESLFGKHVASAFAGLEDNAEWYTTGDGRYLVFATPRPVTGYDNAKAAGVKCGVEYFELNGGLGAGIEPGPSTDCIEVYRYDAEAAEHNEPPIVCVSCAGGAPLGNALFDSAPIAEPAAGPTRPISEDGKEVFFDSPSALVPDAVPGKEHVYEWHGGAISLISSPDDPGDAFFLGSSADGANVFFSTHAQLSAQDTDVSTDIYDARVDGGFAGLTASACTGTGCQGIPATAPIFATPASVTFEGVGNFPASESSVKPSSKPKSKPKKKCGRGFVKKRGRCVVRKAKKSAKGRK